MHQINNSVGQDTSRSSYILSDHRNVLTVRLSKPVYALEEVTGKISYIVYSRGFASSGVWKETNRNGNNFFCLSKWQPRSNFVKVLTRTAIIKEKQRLSWKWPLAESEHLTAANKLK